MIFRNRFICLLFTVVITAPLFTQEVPISEKELIRKINEADGYFIYDENYLKASHIYEEVLKAYPENHNTACKKGFKGRAIVFKNQTIIR